MCLLIRAGSIAMIYEYWGVPRRTPHNFIAKNLNTQDFKKEITQNTNKTWINSCLVRGRNFNSCLPVVVENGKKRLILANWSFMAMQVLNCLQINVKKQLIRDKTYHFT